MKCGTRHDRVESEIMKALAIRQPFAWLIVQGYKEVEYRPWLTHYRGEFLIHATKTIDEAEMEQERTERTREGIIVPDGLPRGGIVDIVTLVDCVPLDKMSQERRFLDRLLAPQQSEGKYRFYTGGRAAAAI
jgi:hypothetical protein